MTRGLAEAAAPPRPSPLRVGTALGGVVLAAVFVFGLGVMVGKRVAESAPAVSAPPAALPTETIPPVAQPAPPPGTIPPEKLTFYDRLSGVATPAPLALPEGQAPPAAAAAPAPVATPPPARTETPVRVAAREPAARPAPPADSPAARIRKLGGRGRFTVQVASVSDRAAAEAAAARVRSEGFEALTVMVAVKGKTWYRIRAGKFPNKRAATQAAGIFRTAYGFDAIAVQQ